MSFADPQTVTPPTLGAQSLPRVSLQNYSGKYVKADRTYSLDISHQFKGDRIRSTARVTRSKISADPLVPATNKEYSQSIYIVADRPVAGFTNAETIDDIAGLCAWLTASTNANATKLVATES